MEFRFSHNQVNLRKILMEFYSLREGFFIYWMESEENIYVQASAENIHKMLIPGEEYSDLRTGAVEDLIRNSWSKEQDGGCYLKEFSDVEIRSGRAASDIMKAFSGYRNYDIDCVAIAKFEDYYEKQIKLTERDFVSRGQASGESAKKKILFSTADFVVGFIYEGRVSKIMDFGAFVTVPSGKEGLIHISEISEERIKNVSDVLRVGQMIRVKVIDIDTRGKARLSMRKLDKSAPTYVLQEEEEEETETIETKLTKIEELYQKSLISEEERIAMRNKALGLD